MVLLSEPEAPPTDIGIAWLEKRLSFPFSTDEGQETAWIALGVQGTWETERSYYLDDVQVVFTRR